MSKPVTTNKPEPTPFEKLQDFARQVLSVPKAEIDRREEEYQKERKSTRKQAIIER